MDSSNEGVKKKYSCYKFHFYIAGQFKLKLHFRLLHERIHIKETFPPYLHSQTECVEDDENEHDVFETSGIYHIPELILVVVLWNISPQRTSFQSVLHTLTLLRTRQR